MALDAGQIDLARESTGSDDLYIEFCLDDLECQESAQADVQLRCQQTGSTEPAFLSVSEDRTRLGVGCSKELNIFAAAVKQLKVVKAGVADTRATGLDGRAACWPMTVVHIAWGRLKQEDLEFSDRDTYNTWLQALVQLCPQAQVMYLPSTPATTPRLARSTPVSPRLSRFSPRKHQPGSPKAFGQRPGDGITYTMPTSPLARRRTATTSKPRRGSQCLFPCLTPAGDVDRFPLEVGAGHPHLELADYKQMYDVGKQYDRGMQYERVLSGTSNYRILAHS